MFKLFVANLDYATSLEEVQNVVNEYCSDCVAELPRDRKTGAGKGFAFITATSQENQEHLLKKLQGASIKGRSVSVKKFTDSPRRRMPRRDEEYNER